MMKDVVEVKPLAGFHLHVRFEDGVEGKIDLKDLVPFEGVFAALRNPVRFAEVRVHRDLGILYWPNGADLDPHVIYAKISGKPIRIAVPEGRPP